MNEYNKNFGELIFQTERQSLDFAKKYGKLTVPLVLAGVAVLFINPGILNWILDFFGFYDLIIHEGEIPVIVPWVFFGAAMLYLIFCIVRISKFKGFQLSVYQKGAVLELVKKTEEFHFDEFLYADFDEAKKRVYIEPAAYITLSGRALAIGVSVNDIPDARDFVEALSAAYHDYVIGKIQSHGIDRIIVNFGGEKLENGYFEKMPLRSIKTVTDTPKYIEITGTSDKGEEKSLFVYFKGLLNPEILDYVLKNHTSAEIVAQNHGATEVIEFDADSYPPEYLKKFEEKHSVSKEKEDYLAFSAILAMTNGDSPKVFKIQWLPKFIVKKGLKNMWGVTDRQTALDTLAELAVADVSTPYANELLHIIEDHKDTEVQEFEVYEQARGNLIKLGFTESELDKISNLNAWDYGRAGFIARNAAYCGFLEEDETWVYLKQAANNAGKEYGSWREYLAAYVLGRAVAYGNASDDIFRVLEYLVKDDSKDRLFAT